MRQSLAVLALPILALAACAVKPACAPHGAWLVPGSLRPVADPVQQAAAAPVILLGEHHDNAADHRWQLDTLKAVYAINPRLALGFEMFPRSSQPVLDEWVRGGMSEADFLARTDWKQVWGFDAAMYMPVFRFARQHGIPMLALNVSRHAVHLVATGGWAALPVAQREGVSTPAPPSAAYRASLQDAMSGHGGPVMTPDRLDHFIDAQLFWDRAMAEGIAAERGRDPQRSVVALMGAGHLQHMDGVPHQLQALGVAGAVVLLPDQDVCAPFPRGYANAVYVE
jgi:uncharacterized iron-regulated protein